MLLSAVHRPAFALLLLIATTCAHHALGALSATAAATTPPSFVIASTPASAERSPLLPSQSFSKQWTISGDADGKIAAIEALALDLPGQVFITYEATAASASKHVGSIKVFGATEALVNSVAVVSKRAMSGAKLAVSRANSSALKPTTGNNNGSTDEALLTEVVLLRKAALKKVITGGSADVVVADDVLFTKKKEDYAFKVRRGLRDAAAENASSIVLTEATRQVVPRDIGSRTVNPVWTIITRAASADDTTSSVPLDIHVASGAFVNVHRVDSDLLPEGALGTVAVANGTVQVATTRSTSGRDTLVVTPSAVNATVGIHLAPSVDVGSLTSTKGTLVTKDLNTTFPSDAVSVFLNGSGNVFVLANRSAVYAQTASFRVAGSGALQVEIGEIHALTGVSAGKDFFGWMWSLQAVTGLAVLDGMMCDWSTNSYSMSISKALSDAATARGESSPRCPVTPVPTKVGGSKPVASINNTGTTSAAAPRTRSLALSMAAALTVVAGAML